RFETQSFSWQLSRTYRTREECSLEDFWERIDLQAVEPAQDYFLVVGVQRNAAARHLLSGTAQHEGDGDIAFAADLRDVVNAPRGDATRQACGVSVAVRPGAVALILRHCNPSLDCHDVALRRDAHVLDGNALTAAPALCNRCGIGSVRGRRRSGANA